MTRICAAILLCVPVVATAQTTPPGPVAQYIDADRGLSLDALVALALEQAPALAAARARVDVATGRQTQASLRPNPKALAERREQFGGIDTQTTIGMSWPLDLFRRDARVAVAAHAVRTAELMADDEVRERAALVRGWAADVLAAVRHLEIAVEQEGFARTRFDLLAARAESGAARPLDRDLADVEWRRSKTEVVSWRASAERAMAALKTSVGLAPTASLRLAAPIEAVSETPALARQRSVTEALAARPDIQALDSEARRAAAEGALAAREARFDLSVTGAFMTKRLGLSPGGDRMNEVMFGVMIDLPWRNRQQGAIASADAARRSAEAEAAARRLDAVAEIDAAATRVRAAEETVALYRDGLIALAAQNVSVVRESFELGSGTLFDVIEEERRYLALQSAYTAALREVVDARTSLLRALGVAS